MNFEELKLKAELNKAISDLDYKILTKIQAESIPYILDGKDLLGIAKTGTGKTAAFSLPILNKILQAPKTIEVGHPRALILAPTRELCAQIGENISNYSKYTSIRNIVLYGGTSTEEQIEQLKKPFDIIVATPIRLFDLMEDNIIKLNSVDFFVLDEADKIIELDSRIALKKILKKMPREKQSLFFSATMNEKIEELSNEILQSPVKIRDDEKVNLHLIEQNVMFLKKENKNKLLLELLSKKEAKSAIIFTNSKLTADNIVRFLTEYKIRSEALHSGKSNVHREKVVDHLKTRYIRYLISTDLGSRGLDFENISHVINYDIPTNAEDYIHRIGRTARYQSKGVSLSFCAKDEKSAFDRIEQLTKIKMKVLPNTYNDESVKTAKGSESKPQTKLSKTQKIKNNLNWIAAKRPKKIQKKGS